MNHENEREKAGEVSDWPIWLDRALAAGEIDEDQKFRQECERAALAGLDMVKLREQKEGIGFRPIPFDRYLEWLAEATSVALEGLFGYYGVGGMDLRSSLRGAVRFAHDLGLSHGEAALAVKYCVAEEVGIVPIGVAALARGPLPAKKGGLGDWEAELERALGSLSRQERSRFVEVDQYVREVFQP